MSLANKWRNMSEKSVKELKSMLNDLMENADNDYQSNLCFFILSFIKTLENKDKQCNNDYLK